MSFTEARTYKSTKDFSEHAESLIKCGCRPVSIVQTLPSVNVGKTVLNTILTGGLGLLLGGRAHNDPEIVVLWECEEDE